MCNEQLLNKLLTRRYLDRIGMWNMKTPQKIKMFIWKATHNILLEEETNEHALLLCDWTKTVWFGSQIQCTPNKQNVKLIRVWLQEMLRKCNQGNKSEAIQNWSKIDIILWAIWKARNEKVYQNLEPNPESTINYDRVLELNYLNLAKESNNEIKE
ncbi:hypothetical protein Ahy_B03g062005 [Arachis hypogaea]|uniref:Reverse transcriptase zinc-binding domain-containing protein n=1 Tax=Arachis hypogaea TaxID=3818 RepID=A0A444ZSU6_ARAHY|nr:hypothetical protein Ahy_B03g062005 [Arachis hypogaea]